MNFLQDLVIDPLWFEIRPGSNETVLLFDNGARRESEVEGRRILVFGSKVHLNLLLRSLDWMGDTLARVLMQKKDARSYKKLFSFML